MMTLKIGGLLPIELDDDEVAELKEALTRLATTEKWGLPRPLDELLHMCICSEAEAVRADRNAARPICWQCSGRGCTICENAESDAELRPSKYDDMS